MGLENLQQEDAVGQGRGILGLGYLSLYTQYPYLASPQDQFRHIAGGKFGPRTKDRAGTRP